MRSHALLQGVSAAGLERLAQAAVRLDLGQGERVCLSGLRNDCLFLVIQGLVRLDLQLDEDKSQLLALVESGHFFGDLEMFNDQPMPGEATAAWRTLLVRIPHHVFAAVYDSEPTIAYRLNHIYARRCWGLHTALALQSIQTVTARLAALLLRLQKISGDTDKPLPLKLTQEELAEMLGTTRQSISQPVRRWKNDGVLAIRCGQIRILKPDVLREVSELNAISA